VGRDIRKDTFGGEAVIRGSDARGDSEQLRADRWRSIELKVVIYME
jgi:hypothetical protein